MQSQNSLALEIAHIHFAVSCRYPLDLRRLTPNYMQFIKDISEPAKGKKVLVSLETGNMPKTSDMQKVFDTSQSWSMFRKNDVRYFALGSPALDNQIIWMAGFNRSCENIRIHCGEALVHRENGGRTVECPLSYPLDQLLLMYILAWSEGAAIHAAGLCMKGRGHIFPGKSGAGKSTLSRLFLGRDNISMMSDDRVITRKMEGAFHVYGTPWAGDAGIAENDNSPLSGMFFIHHSEKNMIKEITPKEAIERLMPVTSIPWYDEETMSSILSFCEELVFNVPAYELHFRPDSEVIEFFEKFVSA